MRIMHLLSTFLAVMLPFVCLNVFPHCKSHRVEEIFEQCTWEKMECSTNITGTDRIVNGTKEDIKKFPFTVQLHIELTDGTLHHYCGGSVISTRFVLTAAHCVDTPEIHYAILAGSSKLNDGKRYEVEEVTIHPSHKNHVIEDYHDADAAVLRTSTEIQFSDYVKAVKLPEPGEEILPGTLADVLGWGFTYECRNVSFPYLMRVQLPVLSDENCKRAYPTRITKYMICAGYKEGMTGACQGDSGGPLVINGKLFGINSWGIGCGRPNCPDVCMKVSEVIDWITNITGEIV